VDVTTAATPTLIQTVAIDATAVQAFEGIAYANDGSKLDAIDLATGEILQTLNLSGATITGLARDGSMLYAMDAGKRLTTIDISSGLMVADGSLVLQQGGGRLSVADGVANLKSRSCLETFGDDHAVIVPVLDDHRTFLGQKLCARYRAFRRAACAG